MTDIVSKFKGNQNKGIIWGLLNEHNVFNGIDTKYVNSIKSEFDTKIDTISNTISSNDNMVSLNKKVISEMIIELNKYKMFQPTVTNSNANVPITSADAQTQKQSMFQKNLETKQNEFDTLINKPKPNTIDFADNNEQDKPNISEMERKLAETIAWREKQLNVVLDKSEASVSEANKWINRDNQQSSSNLNNILLKIDNNTPVDINVINLDNKLKKKVSFPEINQEAATAPFENNFLALLKKKDTQPLNNTKNLDDDIIGMKTHIKEIMDKQTILLDKINLLFENQTIILNFIKELQVKPPELQVKTSDIKYTEIDLNNTYLI
jgi:hypothetical protein